jgi:hypothetical protein
MCVVGNQCASCRASENRVKGLRAQKRAAKATRLGRTAFRGHQANEELWRGPFRAEVKSGKQVNPIGTAFLVFEKQGQQNKAWGDTRPFCTIVMPEDWAGDGIVMLRVSTWRREIAPLLDDAS